MLLDIVLHQPQMLGTVVRHTPIWVWGLLAGLMVLGATQLRDRRASLLRVSIMPVAMTVFSAWSSASAFKASPHVAEVLATWLVTAGAVSMAVSMTRAPASYDPVRREYALHGSVAPLLLMAGIFLVKWSVGVELALTPGALADSSFALGVATLYGIFNGLFVGRFLRLWKIARHPVPVAAV